MAPAQAAAFAYDGTLQVSFAGTSLLALVPALAGMIVGRRIRARVCPDLFRLCFLIGLPGLGADLILRGVL